MLQVMLTSASNRAMTKGDPDNPLRKILEDDDEREEESQPTERKRPDVKEFVRRNRRRHPKAMRKLK